SGLKKTGAGTVTLSGANSYTGTTDVQTGALRVRSLSSLPGAVVVGSGTSLVLMGDLAGTGAGASGVLGNTITGTGTIGFSNSLTAETITLNAAKAFDGVYDIGGGTLAVSHAGAFGAGNSFASRTQVQGAATTGKLALSGNISVANELAQLAARTTSAPHLTSAGNNAWNGHIDGVGTGQYNIESTSGTLTIGGILNAPDSDTAQRTFVFSGSGNTTVNAAITDEAIVWDATNVGTRSTSNNDNVNVVKRGTGTLTIGTASADFRDYWRGRTTIEQGTLVVIASGGVDGELRGREIAVRSGATFNVSGFTEYKLQIFSDPDFVPSTGDEVGQILTGAGTINATNLFAFDDSIIRPGDDGVGTLIVNGKLTVQSFTAIGTGSLGSSVSTPGTVGAGVNDLLQVNGNVQFDASGSNAINVNLSPTGGSLANGTYTVLQYTGTRTGTATASNFKVRLGDSLGNALGATRQTMSAVLNDASKRVDVTVAGAALTGTWTGAAGNQWDVNTSVNWTTLDQRFFNLDHVVFNEANAGNQFEIEIPDDVAPASVTFNNSTNVYAFTGDRGITGSGPVTLAGTGTVVFASNFSSHLGTTTISPGATLQVGNGTSNGNHFGTGALVNNGTFILNKAVNSGETIASIVSGSGTVRVDSGNLTLSGNNTYTGSTVVNGGQLLVENLATGTPLGTAAVGTALNGGVLRINGQTATLAEPLAFNGGQLAIGGGTLAKVTATGAISVGAEGGRIQVDSGTNIVNGLGVHTSNGLTINATTSLAAGGVLTASVDEGSTLVMGGAITGAGGLTKSGAGTVELIAGATATGPTMVQSGALKLIGAGNLSATQISVANGATFDTTGKGSALTLAAGQTLNLAGLTGPAGGSITLPASVLNTAAAPAKAAGNVTATSGSQVAGIGVIAGNLTTQTGSTLRVGRAGITTAFGGTPQTEDFESYPAGAAFTGGSATGTMPGWQFFDLGAVTNDAAFAVTVPPQISGASKMLAQTSLTTDFQQNPGPIAGAVAISPLTTTGAVDRIRVDFAFDGGGDTDAANLDTGVAFGFRDSSNFFQLRLSRGSAGGAGTRLELASIAGGVRSVKVDANGTTSFNANFLEDVLYTAELVHDASTGFVSYSILDSNNTALMSGHTVDDAFRANGGVGVLVTNDYAAWDNLSVQSGSTLPDTGLQQLAITGNLTMIGGTLQLDLASTSVYDVLKVDGALAAGGTLAVGLSEGFTPQLGDAFQVLEFGSATGAFGTLSLPALSPGLAWDASGLLTSGFLEVVAGGSGGDFNNDARVDGADFLAWQRGFGTTFNATDLANWKTNFGVGTATPIVAGVPEPATATLISITAACIAALRIRAVRREIVDLR
ncbi:MAG: autotransporter-associated beta strand repeat-containing protein, partial [Pirellulales bacterium]|nr:autotransporter-associated beta strand repeat-containing protein [Pirellulales bacterium]